VVCKPPVRQPEERVGIVLDVRKPLVLRSITVRTDTPGFTCIVKAGASSTGPFQPVSAGRTVGPRTAFPVHERRPSRYYLLWITSLAPGTGPHYRADIDDVSAQAAPG
jgi:hypothetical protein